MDTASRNSLAHKAALVLLFGLLLLTGCTSEKDSPTLPGAHPSAWMDRNSIDFHGTVALQAGLESCSECHGDDLAGRGEAVSCFECHGSEAGGCVRCHGGLDNETGAPPDGLRGEASDTTLAVGAHTAHMELTELAGPLDCNVCHIEPLFVLDSTHLDFGDTLAVLDSIAEITWHGIADSGTIDSSGAIWNRTERTCTDTYCHGNFGGGDTSNVPIWTEQNQADCGSCHAVQLSPGRLGWKHEVHVVTGGLSCNECHATVADDAYNIVGPELHVDGQLQFVVADTTVCNQCHGSGALACTGCHGGLDNSSGAPPGGLHGETVVTQLAVGAHTVHVEGAVLSDSVACDECHLVPSDLIDPGHLGADSVAELTWGVLAGGQSAWDRGSATCSGTYCHGNFTGGYPANAPVWTGLGQAVCGSCHDRGVNPADLGWYHEYHVGAIGLPCIECHASVVDSSLTIVDLALHVNGQVDTLTRDQTVCDQCHGQGASACVGCHGGDDNQSGAPPIGLDGETLTTELAIGAHTVHIDGGAITDGSPCEECHTVPADLQDPGHLGADSVAEMIWGSLAGNASSWDRLAADCSDTYCHGNFGGGDKFNQPVWTGADQAACGSCHDVGAFPATLGWKHAFHVGSQNFPCIECHANVVDSSLAIIGLDLHVNGVADTLTRDVVVCEACHSGGVLVCALCHGGTDNQTGAPPLGLRGETATIELAVGAHTTHVEGGSISDPTLCSECHIVPGNVTDPGHLGADSVAEMTFGSLAGPGATWNRAGESCTDTYCHGNFSGGNGSNTPVWTRSGQAVCGTCHDDGGRPQDLSGRHEKHVNDGVACYRCHDLTLDSGDNVDAAQFHVNGQNDIRFSPNTGSFDGSRCFSPGGCHGNEDW